MYDCTHVRTYAKNNFCEAHCETCAGLFQAFIREAVQEVHYRSPRSKVVTFQYESGTRRTLLQPPPHSNGETFEHESNTGSKLSAAPDRKAQLCNTKIVHKVSCRSFIAKVATFQYQSSTRSKHPERKLKSRKLLCSKVVRGTASAAPAHKACCSTRGSGNWRGGPSTFAILSRILRQTFAKIRLESCTQHGPKSFKTPTC